MHGKINVRFLLLVTVAGLVLGSAWFFVHRAQKKRRLGDYLTQANRAEEEKKFDRAARLLRAYVLAVPTDLDARVRYGGLLEKLSRTPRARADALSVYEQVLLKDPARLDARVRAAELAVELHTDSALTHVEELLKANGNDARALFLQGLCLEARARSEEDYKKEADYKKAVAAYIRSCGAEPRAETFVRWASVVKLNLKREDKPEDVTATDLKEVGPRRVMNELVKARSDHFDAYLARALYRRTYDPDDELVRTDLQKARELAPDEVPVLLASADLAVELAARNREQTEAGRQARQRLWDEARGYLLHGKSKSKEEAALYVALANVEARAGQRDEAIKWLGEGRKAVRPGGLPDVLFALGELYAEAGEGAGANEVLEQLGKLKQDKTRIDFLRGLLLVRQEQWYEGSGILERVRPLLVTSPEMTVRIDLLLARCYRELGDTERRLLTYRHAVAAAPLDDRPRLGLADTLVALGRSAEALDEYRRATQLERSPVPAWVSLIRLLVSRNLTLPAPERNWTEVDGLLQRLEMVAANSVEFQLMRAEVRAATGDVTGAEALLLERLRNRPGEAEVWFALAALADRNRAPAAFAIIGGGGVSAALSESKWDTARAQWANGRANAILDEAQRALGDTVEVRIARVSVTPFGSAEPVLNTLAVGTERFPTGDRVRLLRALAEAYWLIDRPAAAGRLWAEITALRPTELTVRLLQFDAAVKAGDEAAMKTILGDIHRLEGGGPLWKYAEATRLIWRARRGGGERSGLLSDARALLTAAAERRPGWARVPLALAQIDELEGMTELMLNHLKQAIRFGDRQFSVVKRVVQLLDERDRAKEADEILGTILHNPDAQAPVANEFQQLAAEVSLRLDADRAVALARKAVSADTNDYRQQVWLARILSVTGHADEAEAKLEAAAVGPGARPDLWVTFVQHTVRHRSAKPARIEEVLKRAHEALAPGEPLALAGCYTFAGKRKEAEQWYLTAFAANRTDVRVVRAVAAFYQSISAPEQARPYLAKLTSSELRAGPEDVAWARRNLALALGLRSEAPDLAGALALLDQNAAAGEAPDDLRARAVVTAALPGRRQDVIRLLERAEKLSPPAPEHQFLLAKLYELEGNWPKARDRMLRLIALQKDNARYLEAFARSLIRRGDLGEARVWIGRLADTEPGARPAESALRVLTAAGLFEQVSWVATGSDATEAQSAAEKLYKTLKEMPVGPDGTLALAGFYGRTDRPGEALALCEEALKSAPLERVIGAALTATSGRSAKEAHFAQVEGWLNQALVKKPDAHDLRFLLATLREQQGRYEDAEAEYGRVLAKVPTHAGALNNLALLLALRGKGAEAVLAAQRALAATTGAPPELLDTRAVAYTAAKDWAAAQKDLEVATAAGQAPAYFHLAVVFWNLGDKKKVAEALQKARSAGLWIGQLHPLERPTYEKLLK
jgi:lipopolysaccharide biosynthesis regulator YciM